MTIPRGMAAFSFFFFSNTLMCIKKEIRGFINLPEQTTVALVLSGPSS